jgi:diaminopimelate epimerase
MCRALQASCEGNLVAVEMGRPLNIQWNLLLPGAPFSLHFLNTGVPHTIFFTDDIEQVDLGQIGPWVRFHTQFAPTGTNVNAVQVMANQTVKIRTYERGVEAETLACGTGATAAALAAAHLKQLKSPVKVLTRSQEQLEIRFCREKDKFTEVKMIGAAHYIYKGEVDLA